MPSNFFFSLFLVFAANNAASFFFLSPSLQETARGLSLLSFFFPLVFLSTNTKHVSFLCYSFFFFQGYFDARFLFYSFSRKRVDSRLFWRKERKKNVRKELIFSLFFFSLLTSFLFPWMEFIQIIARFLSQE